MAPRRRSPEWVRMCSVGLVDVLITEFIKEDSPFCLTRAITRTMIGPCPRSAWFRAGLAADRALKDKIAPRPTPAPLARPIGAAIFSLARGAFSSSLLLSSLELSDTKVDEP